LSRVKMGVSLVLVASGLALFAASVLLMNDYKVLPSILAAVLGFTSLSMGLDVLREAS
jgi:uncharacterized membrane protein (UPF0136 family)